jgi:colicin import membrane protein
MKHYILSDDIRNLLMQTILKEENGEKDAEKYAATLAAGDPNDKSEEGRGGDAKAYKEIRKKKEKEAADKAAAETPASKPDRGQPTTDPKIMAARRAEIAKAAQGAVGEDDPTDSMRGRFRNPHTDPKAREGAKKAYQAFKDREEAFRAGDAARARKRAAALAAKRAETQERAQATAAAVTKPTTKPTKKPASRKK